MPDPMMSFDSADQQFVKRLISLVLDYKTEHKIALDRVEKTGPYSYSYWIALPGDVGPAASNPLRYEGNLVKHLYQIGFATKLPSTQELFRFTDEAFNWYQEITAPSEDDIRAIVGHELYRRYKKYFGDPQPFDLSNQADSFGLARQTLEEQLHILLSLGYVEKAHYLQRMSYMDGDLIGAPIDPFEELHLSEPKGLEWAVAGCPPIASFGKTSVAVQVSVHLGIQQTITHVQAADVPDELKDKLELLLHRLESELDKDDPDYRPLKDAVEVASNSWSLLQPLAKFMVAHQDKLERAYGGITGLFT